MISTVCDGGTGNACQTAVTNLGLSTACTTAATGTDASVICMGECRTLYDAIINNCDDAVSQVT